MEIVNNSPPSKPECSDIREDFVASVPTPKEFGDEVEDIDSEDSEKSTPEVRIRPATPEVLAAHRNANIPPKKSVITVTLRPKSASSSLPVSRSPSMISSKSNGSRDSTCSTTGIPQSSLTNGFHDSDYSDATPEVRISPPDDYSDNCISSSRSVNSKVQPSIRSTNSNKTASFVVLNTPTVSPRPIRPKPLVMNGHTGSCTKVSGKPRDALSCRSKIGNTNDCASKSIEGNCKNDIKCRQSDSIVVGKCYQSKDMYRRSEHIPTLKKELGHVSNCPLATSSPVITESSV